MAIPAVLPRYSPEEYLALERAAEHKSEYIDGEIVAMAGASREHNIIAVNLAREISGQLVDRPRPCDTYGSDMRVRVGDTGLYTYPDLTVVCTESAFDDDRFDTLVNPTVIFEVLSPSTASYDRGEKFVRYRRIESLREYVLVSQGKPFIEQFVRQDLQWVLTEHRGLDAIVRLPSIDCTLSLERTYLRVQVDSRQV